MTPRDRRDIMDWLDSDGPPPMRQVRELLDHISALSATIKRLEIPVADGEVAELERYYTNAQQRREHAKRAEDVQYAEGTCDAYDSAMPILRRQAREIERAAAGNGDPVRFYERDFYVLSNFSAFSLDWHGLHFDTSEAAYQWSKFTNNKDIQHAIHRAPSAHEAFKIAERKADCRRPDWNEVKLDYMREILRAKAGQHEYVRRKLLATGNRQLVEDSWRDDYWGWGPNKDGQNMLGKLWMEVRAVLSLNSVETREMKP